MIGTLILALIGAAALAAAAASVVFFLRAREREESGPADALGGSGLTEMRALGNRIETLVGQQQLQGETARQQLAQKIDAVGEHVAQQRHHVAGLQNELRHEVQRRDAELDEIRTQLATIQHATALGGAPTAPLALPAPEADAGPEDDAGLPTFTFEAPPTEPAAFAPAPPAPFEPAVFPSEPTGDGLAAPFGETPFADGWDTGLAAAPAALAPDAPAFSDPFALVDPPAAPSPSGLAAAMPSDVPPTAEPTFADDAFATFDEEPSDALAAFEVSDLEPFDFVPPDEEPAAPPAPEVPAAEPPRAPLPALFEDVSFSPVSAAPPAAPAPEPAVYAVPVERIAPPAPSTTAWVARSDRPEASPAVFEMPSFEMPSFAPPSTVAAPSFEAPAFGAPAAEVPAFTAPAFEVPAFAPPPPPLAAAPAPAEAAPFVAPAGADNLTVISTIDEDVQRALYMAGVTSLDEIARWSRGDARRIAAAVSVSEDTILNQWVFEAQAALFHSYSAQQTGR